MIPTHFKLLKWSSNEEDVVKTSLTKKSLADDLTYFFHQSEPTEKMPLGAWEE